MTTNGHPLDESTLRSLTLPTNPYLSCDECFDLSDSFAELVVDDPSAGLPHAMVVHLRACPACAEEAESLVVLVAETSGVDAQPALTRLNAALLG